MPLPPSDNNLSHHDKSSTRTSPRAPWVLILPLALAAGVLLQQSQNTDNANTMATNNVPTSVQSPTPSGKELTGKPATYVLFVPDDNGDLRRETVVDQNWVVNSDDIAQDGKNVRAQAATKSVNNLIARHTADFPAGAQLLADASIDNNNRTVLNFNQKFTDVSFWQGSTRTISGVYAIVNTAIESQKSIAGESGTGEVQFLVEGKPIQTLGELDMQSPLKPDLKLVANNSQKTVNAR